MGTPSRKRAGRTALIWCENLEDRVVLSAAFDITGLTALRANSAFSNITGSGVGIAVLDTGVDAANPDLTPNVVAFYNAVENPVSTTSVSPSNAVDNDGHGSHVSGIAASSDPAIGVAYGAKLVDIKVIADSGESQLGGDPVLRGLEWVAANYQTYNIKVVNMSLGESGVNDNTVTAADARDAEAVEIAALEKIGITVVTASGNSYANNPTPGESFPAVVSTIGVANTWATTGQASDFNVPYGGQGDSYYAVDTSATVDTLASTSQRSTLDNQLAAPGEDIYSDWNGTLDSSNGSDLLHNTISGTSMATPFIAGVVALMQQAAKTFGGHYLSDPNQILQILQQTADTVVDSNNPNNARYNSQTGQTSNLPETGLSFKRVDVLKAIEEVERLVTGGAITNGPAPGPDTDNTAATATPVNNIDGTVVDTFDGSIGTDGEVEVGANDVDLYKLDVVSPGQVTFTLSQPSSGAAFAAALRLFDSNGNLIAHIDGASGAYPTLTSTGALAVGTYYLGISSVGNESYTTAGAGAANGGAPGDYLLQIQLFNPDPNGTLQGAAAVDLTEPTEVLTDSNTGRQYTDLLQEGELGSDPPPTGSSTRTTVASDVDMFQVTAPDDGTLTLTTESNIFSGDVTFIEVFDSNGTSLGTANGTQSSVLGQNTLSQHLTAGDTYYIAVTVPQNSAFNPTNPYLGRTANATPSDQPYNLHLRFDNGDADGSALTANTVNIGDAITANIGTDNSATVGATGAKDVDWYNYSATQSGLFDVTAQSTAAGFTPIITIWEYTNGQSNIVKIADTSSSSLFASPSSQFSPAAVTPPGGSANLIIQVQRGATFFVAISGQGNSNFNWYAQASGNGGLTGGYTLATAINPLSTLTTLSDNSINSGTPEAISVGQTVNANLGADGSLVIGSSDVDLYKLVAPASETLTFRTFTNQEGDADTVLRVFDSNGNQLAANDNIDSTTTASQVTLAVTQGQTYYIGVDGAGTGALTYNPLTGTGTAAGSTGNYSLLVSPQVNGFSVNSPAAVPAFAGGTITFTVTLTQSLTSAATVAYTTADGTAVAGTDYTATSGTLTFAPGVVSQTVTVPVLPEADSSAQATKTFALTLSSPAGAQLANPTGTGSITDEPITTQTFSAGKPAKYIDSTGGRVQLILTGPGTGTAVFVNGAQDPADISVTGSTGATRFAINGKNATVADISITGSLNSLTGKGITLGGNLNITGSVNKLALGNVDGGTSGGEITLGAAGAPVVVSLGHVNNESFTTPGSIASLSAIDWLTSGTGTAVITAQSIAAIKSNGDFGASISAAALGAVKVSGSLPAGTWTIAGGGSSIKVVGAADAGWTATFAGALGAVQMSSDGGSLTALSIHSLKISDNLSSATIRTTGTTGTVLGTVKVGRAVQSSQIISAGSVGNVSAGAFLDSELLVGVSNAVTSLPTAASDFAANDSIVSFSVTGKISPFSFSNSDIAAATIGKVNVALVDSNNNGTPFGIVAESLGSFSNRGVLHWTSKEPASLLVNDGDLVEQIVT